MNWKTLSAAMLSSLLLVSAAGWKLGWFGKEETTVNQMVVDLGNGVELTLCWCPPGTFLMGSPITEEDRSPDEIQHQVTLTQGFWMAKTETTQAQWEAVMSGNPSFYKGKESPVDLVTWYDAKAFAAALTERLRQEGKIEPGWELGLPTEAQWEYACRAGTTTAYHTGDKWEDLGRAGWHGGNSVKSPSKFETWLRKHPRLADWFDAHSGDGSSVVGKKAANAFGLHDMHGNVWEWCEDDLREYAQGSVTDPVGSLGGQSVALRGGCWGCDANTCRSAYRYSDHADADYALYGFRVCLVEKQ